MGAARVTLIPSFCVQCSSSSVSARIIAPSLSFQFPRERGKRREAELGLTWNTCVDLWLFSQIIANKVLYMLTLVV